MIRLHVFPPSPRAAKVIALADHVGVDVELCPIDLFKGEQHGPAFASLNPNERMPVLEDGDFVLWESNAILQYLASRRPASRLWPSDPRGQADVLRWLSWEAAHWSPACGILAFERVVKKLSGQGPPDEAQVTRGEQEIPRWGRVLDGWLKGRRWLVGDDLTIADFAVGAPMVFADAARYPLIGFSELSRWYDALASIPAWKKAFGFPRT